MTTTEAMATWSVTCPVCGKVSAMSPKAGRLWLRSEGVIILEYFCPSCYEFNSWRLRDVDLAQDLTSLGVETTVVPPRSSHPQLCPVTEAEVQSIAVASMDMFNRIIAYETGTNA